MGLREDLALRTRACSSALRVFKEAFFDGFAEEGGGLGGASVGGHEGVGGAGGGEELVVAGELVGDLDLEKGFFGDAGANGYGVVVLGGAFVLHADVEDGEHEAAGFDLLVGEAVFAEELGAADFQPRQVVGVIDDAHHVSFGVTYLDRGDAFDHGGREEGIESRDNSLCSQA